MTIVRDIERYDPFGDVYFAFNASGRLVGALRKVERGTNRGKYVGRPEIEMRRAEVAARIERNNEYAKGVHAYRRNVAKSR